MTAAEVHHWLSSLNLHEQYETLLVAAGYDTLAKCQHLNDAVLDQIGVKPAGHRRRILMHLPRGATEPSLPASCSDSEEDDREIYDIPPLGRRSDVVLKQESTYTNIMEMNEIPKPVLPPKKRLPSDDEVGAKLGIVSPPVKPRLPQGIFDTDGTRAKPKVCVVNPEKRPPVPARRVSKAAELGVENPSNDNVGDFECGLVKEVPLTAIVAPVAMPRTISKPQDLLHDDLSKPDTAPVIKCSVPSVAMVANIGPFQSAGSVPTDSPLKPPPCNDADTVDAVLAEKRLNLGLEQALEELLNCAKRSVLQEADTHTTTREPCATSAARALHSPDNTISVSSESHGPYRLETRAEQSTDNCCKVPTDLEFISVGADENSSVDDLSQLLRKTAKPSDELVCEVFSEERDSGHRASSECHYPPPAFPPPPLPACRPSHDSTYHKPRVSSPPRTSTSSMLGFGDFAEERVRKTEPVKPPRPPPRRQPSAADVVDNAAMMPTVAGFSSALDDYLVKKITSPSVWLKQSGHFSQISESDFGPGVDLELLPEFTPDVSPSKQSVAPLNSDKECLIPAAKDTVPSKLSECSLSVDEVVMRKKNKETESIVEPLSANDFKEVTCNNDPGYAANSCGIFVLNILQMTALKL